MYIREQKVGVGKIIFLSLFCLPRLHLFDQKYSNKSVILRNIITI